MTICDCIKAHNGMGLAGRECDCEEEIAAAKPFKPSTFVNEALGLTICLFEDAVHAAKPLHEGVHHFIDELRALDDGRLVGIQFWVGVPPTPSE